MSDQSVSPPTLDAQHESLDAEVEVRVANGVGHVRLNRPEVRNALDRAVIRKLHVTFVELESRGDVRAYVITGAGDSFCAGGDIREFAALHGAPAADLHTAADEAMQMYRGFGRLRKPLVVGVRGHALAGGCGLALSGDFVIAGENSQFGYPETRRGFVPALVSVQLSRLVGPRVALDLLLTGRVIGSEDALRYGLITRVVPDTAVDDDAIALARSLAVLDPVAIQLTRELYYRVRDLPLDGAYLAARDVNVLMRYSDGFIDGAAAFADGTGFRTTPEPGSASQP